MPTNILMAAGEQKKMRQDLVYYDECYKIIGAVMSVYNKLGYGYEEKTYQKATAAALDKIGLKFIEQLYAPIEFEGKTVGRNYFDFLIEENIVLELKRGDHFSQAHIKQVYQYLINKNLKLGILVYFAPHGIHYKRIVNVD